ncbi:MAG: hypothetical protein D6798_13800 [Deltaproteobacteria bacterium]|nr:MAG: hypothetical protein D6798_13800 [Deltaproteobacteria bacterium]
MHLLSLLLVSCTGAPPGAETPAPDRSAVDEPLGPAPLHSSGPPVPPGSPGPAPGGPPPFHLQPDLQLVGERAEHPHNVLIVSLDTVRADRLGVYGGRAETPTLSALAARGGRFSQAISNFPETCLSHQAMLTGVLPEVHGNVPAVGGSRYRGPNLAEIAAAEGYATAAFIGGVTLTDRACGFGRGFGHFDDRFPVDPADMRRPAADVTAAAARWLADRQGPWLAFVHYFDAHFPYTPQPPWDTRYDPDYDGDIDGTDAALRPYRDGGRVPSPRDLAHVLALYDGELSQLDGMLAPLLAAVDDDTIVVVTSDHGESFEHGYYFNHRAGLWDPVLRVPLIVAGPGVAPGVVVDSPVQLIDVAPTVLELAGLPRDARMQGRSQAPALRGDGAENGESPPAFSITDPWMPDPQWAARTSTHKVIVRTDGVLGYDLRRDPGEEHPLSEPPASLLRLRADYDAQVASLAAWQAPAPGPRPLGIEEQERLEALGYLAPAGTAPRPGAASGEGGADGNGQRRGPPTPPKR